MNRILLALIAALACVSGLSCGLNDYCLECGKDAGVGDSGGNGDADASTDATDASTCVPSGPEICDGKDNDCNGLIDDGVLPDIGSLCDNQMGECAGGVKQCTTTFHCSVTVAKACFDANDTTSCPNGETCKADDASTDHITCSKNPKPELCDGKDNNCNGMTDEGNPLTDMNGNTFASKCGPSGGTCVQGQNICAVAPNCGGSGQPACGTISCVGAIGPQPEQCDTLDNDCDGMIDEDLTNLGTCGAPEPGCASPPCGLCKLGTLQCVDSNMGMTASQVCIGAVNPTFELCNSKDDDCDGQIDEDFNLMTDANNCGACGNVCGAGLTNSGNADWACSAGTCVITSCKAGYHDNNASATDGCEFGQCFASGPEVCDGQDNDCDGVIDEQAAIGAAPPICATQGACAGTIAACPCMNTPDTNCTGGGTCVTTCAAPSGWKCTYGSNVSTDSSGNIIAETKCDGIDNDCNGIIDDNQPPMAHADSNTTFVPPACNDGKAGICEGTGHYQCDDGTFTGSTPGGNLTGPALCNITTPGQPQAPETCNNLDDDCDGVVDNGAATGNLPGQEWVNIGGGHQMMKYEASRPDATSANGGVVSAKACSTVAIASASESGASATYATSAAHGFAVGNVVTIAGMANAAYNGTYQITVVPSATSFTVTLATTGLSPSSGGTASTNCVATCSTSGRQPWTNVTYLQALAACNAVGATLCTESTWHRTCSAVAPVGFPKSIDSSSTGGTLIEAEDYFGSAYATSGGVTRSWIEDETPGFSSISDMEAQPVSGGNIVIGSANGSSPRLDYRVTFPNAGTYRIFVRMFASTNNGGNFFSAYLGMSASSPAAPTLTYKNTSTAAWQWIAPASGFTVAAGATDTISIYMGDPGVKVDAIFITTNTGTPSITLAGPGLKWAMQPTPNYTSQVCNDQNYTGTGAGGPLASGTLASCYADEGGGLHVFDLSGNVKEWTLAHQPGQNPIRGGAFNNTANGIDCPLDFTLADDTFFFTDVGFRCCR